MATEMEDPDTLGPLPPDEHRSVWDQTERKFWLDFQRDEENGRATAEQAYTKATMEVRVELGTMAGKRSQLTETRERLAKELTKVEEELAHIAEDYDGRATQLVALEKEYRDNEQIRLEKAEHVSRSMKKFFRGHRGEESASDDEDDESISRLHDIRRQDVIETREEQYQSEARTETSQHANGHQPMLAPAPLSPPEHPANPANVIVDIVNADGQVIGPVQRIQPWNQWVEAIQDLPIKRPVTIRRGRKFNKEHVASIYDRSEAKGVKWLSCLIQATGDIQTQRCISCDKNQGAFEHCTIVGGPMFQKCGNCEWNRQGCHRQSSDQIMTPPELTHQSREMHSSRQAWEEADLQARKHHAAQQAIAAAAGIMQETPLRPALQPNPELNTRRREIQILNGDHKGPVMQGPQQMLTPHEPKEYPGVSGFTPANMRSRPPSREFPTPSQDFGTPTVLSAETSPRPGSSDGGAEITRENLALRHNGVVYTYPDCMEGVPVAKIDSRHPYWEPRWPTVKSVIEPALQSWRQKYENAIEARAKGESGGSARFQTGRQVNRGVKILEFLDEGEISPYQLLGKKWTHSGKGAITSYDTLFRLSETLSELAKYNLDITPVQWMRHRLHELIEHHGPTFNVAKTVHDFYHDSKLTALRYKNGYKNIGRPSGLKMGRPDSAASTNTPIKDSKKRKSTHSQTGTPSVGHSPLLPYEEMPFSTHLDKRPKHLSPTTGTLHDEFETDSHTDTDSWSGAAVSKYDFRLYQVKTRLYTSSNKVTQYWTYNSKDRSFEHEVLKETEPNVVWGTHREPIDFNVSADEIQAVAWNVESLLVQLFMGHKTVAKVDGRPRGDVIVAFKRGRSMRRFLELCRDMRLTMVKERPHEMDRRWMEMRSEPLPDRDEDVSEVLRE